MLRRVADTEHARVRLLHARVLPVEAPVPPPCIDLAQLRTRLTHELARGFGALVAELVARMGDATDLTLRAHPDDLASLGELDPAATRVGDATLTRGGCVVESTESRLDATVEARVALLLAAVEVAS